MSDESSSFNLSFLSPSTFHNTPINKNQIKLVSTPINGMQDETDLSPVNLDEITRSTNPKTPVSRNELKLDNLHSILKSGRNKSSSKKQYQDTSIPESVLRKHPELRLASSNGDINPVKGARVLFSPTKEVLSYREDYFDGYNEEESISNLRRIRRNKKQAEAGGDEYTIDLTSNNIDDDANKSSEKESKTGILTKLITDPTIPYVLSLYLQLFFNLLLISIILYLLFIFISTIKADINHKLEVYTSDALQEISVCSREYYRNKCSTENGNTRVPALEKACTVWAKCMNRDPQLIGKSKITAETFADIVNGFIRPISWKSLIFMNFMIFGSLFITNIAFGSYRNSSNFNNHMEKDKKTERKYQKQIKEQNELLSKYQKQLQEQNNTTINNNDSYVTAYADNTTSRIHPSHAYNQIMLHEHNNDNSFASSFVNRNNPYN